MLLLLVQIFRLPGCKNYLFKRRTPVPLSWNQESHTTRMDGHIVPPNEKDSDSIDLPD